MLTVLQKTRLHLHASVSAPRFDHATLPIPSLSQRISAGARNRATVSWLLSQPLDTFPCPVSVSPPANSPLCSRHPALRARGRTCARYDARPGRNSVLPPPSPEVGPSRGRLIQGYASSPHIRHRSRLDASPCVIAAAERDDSRTGLEDGDEGRGKFSYIGVRILNSLREYLLGQRPSSASIERTLRTLCRSS